MIPITAPLAYVSIRTFLSLSPQSVRGTGDSFGSQFCPLPTDAKADWLEGDAFRNGAREKHLAKDPNTLLTRIDLARLSTIFNTSTSHNDDERHGSSRSHCSFQAQARLRALRTPWSETTAGNLTLASISPG